MRREEVLSMNVDRNLDKLVAEIVLGLPLEEGRGLFAKSPMLKMFLSEEEYNKPNLVIRDERYLIAGGQREIPRYSTEISAAWEVVEKMRDKKVYLDIRVWPDEYQVLPHQNENNKLIDRWIVKKNSLPEAISKAALLAVLNL